MAFITSDWKGNEYFPIHDFHHIEFYVCNAKQTVHYYRSAFGFKPYAYAGPETGVKNQVSYVLKNNTQFFVFTTPLSSKHPELLSPPRLRVISIPCLFEFSNINILII